MGLITTGFPKSGNHALVKACQLLGQPCEVNHYPYAEKPDGTCVFIKRDPRNIVLSWLRFNGQPVTKGMFISSLKKFRDATLFEDLATFAGWLDDPAVLVVKYEDLIATDAELRRIATFLGVPYLDDAFANLPGMTRTWHADHSDYTTLWNAATQNAWDDAGGAEVLTRWGY